MTLHARANQFIEASAWRAELTQEQLARINRDAFVRSYQAGATVCARGSPAIHWLGVMEGMLKVDTVSADGRSTTFAGVPSGAWFGEGAVLKGEPRPYAVVAIRDSTVMFLSRITFQWLLEESRPFSRWVIDQLNARLGHYVAMIETLRFHEASARVAYCLSELFNPQLFPSTTTRLSISQDEIAKLSGLTRQNVNRALQELAQAGYLRAKYGTIEILNLEGLQYHARK